MNPEDLVGKTEICSECGKQKTIQLASEQGPDKQVQIHSSYLKCEDCLSPDLEKGIGLNYDYDSSNRIPLHYADDIGAFLVTA